MSDPIRAVGVFLTEDAWKALLKEADRRKATMSSVAQGFVEAGLKLKAKRR